MSVHAYLCRIRSTFDRNTVTFLNDLPEQARLNPTDYQPLPDSAIILPRRKSGAVQDYIQVMTHLEDERSSRRGEFL